MKRILLISIILFGIFIQNTNAQRQQIQRFRRGQPFLEELGRFVKNSKNEDALIALQRFDTAYNSGTFNEEEKQWIFDISNVILKKRVKAYPDFYLFMNMLSIFSETNHPHHSYSQWKKSFMYLIKRKGMPKINEYVEACIRLFETEEFYKSRSTKWVRDNNKFEITFYNKKVRFNFLEEMNLTCYALDDSMMIIDTHGSFDPIKNIWYGNGGKVTWERAGLNPNEVYAMLGNYHVDMTKYTYKADTVTFYNPFVPDKLTGWLEDRVFRPVKVINSEGEDSVKYDKINYPQFDSYDKNMDLFGVIQDVDFTGGFAMYGNKFVGTGTDNNPAKIVMYRNADPFLIAQGKAFVIRKDNLITGVNTSVKFTLNTGDSIYHPNVIFRYMINRRRIALVRDPKGVTDARYYNSYHNLNMDFEMLHWDIDEPILKFRMLPGAAKNETTIRSADYFSKEEDEARQGIDDINPVVALKIFLRHHTDEPWQPNHYTGMVFYDSDFAKEYGASGPDDMLRKKGRSISEIRALLHRFMNEGMVLYNINSGKAIVTDRFGNYLEARAGRRDYDAMNIYSTTPRRQENALYNLETNDLSVKGVDSLRISPVQNVFVKPADSTIVLQQNRNFTFNGSINVGLATITGKEFEFDYDNFRIDLSQIDSIRLKVITDSLDVLNQRVVVDLQSIIESKDGKKFSGKVFIDDKSNKSGVKKDLYPQYPMFQCLDTGYVFYDKKKKQEDKEPEDVSTDEETENEENLEDMDLEAIADSTIQADAETEPRSIYPRENFYFQIYPFTMTQLDSLKPRKRFADSVEVETKDTVGLALLGNFKSGGIFPDFEEKLIVMDDYSLGFYHDAEDTGVELFGGKGTYHQTIKLSNRGLEGEGEIRYLVSVIRSKDFTFFPDSMNTYANEFLINQQKQPVEYPSVFADSSFVHWEPYNDSLIAHQTEVPIGMYVTGELSEPRALLNKGALKLEPVGLTGRGEIKITNALIQSNLYNFKNQTFNADSGTFTLTKAEIPDTLLFTDIMPEPYVEPYFHVDKKKLAATTTDEAAGSTVAATDSIAETDIAVEADNNLDFESDSIAPANTLVNDSIKEKPETEKQRMKREKKEKKKREKEKKRLEKEKRKKQKQKQKQKEEEKKEEESKRETEDLSEELVENPPDSIVSDTVAKFESQQDSTAEENTRRRKKPFGRKDNENAENSITQESAPPRKNHTSLLVDFNDKTIYGRSNDKDVMIQFPKNKYICYPYEFKWFMEDARVEINSDMDKFNNMDTENDSIKFKDIYSGVRYFSMHPDQDSLNFSAGTSHYSMFSNSIFANQVRAIMVADAIIYPTEQIKIEPDAQMETLKSASIVANNDTRYHSLFNADIDIYNRHNYSARGKFNYIDEFDGIQVIEFDTIRVDSLGPKKYKTLASGKIKEEDKFLLSPNYQYYGNVNIISDEQFLRFDGWAKIIHSCDSTGSKQLKFKSSINPDSIYIPIVKNYGNIDLYAGQYITDDSAYIYSSFLSTPNTEMNEDGIETIADNQLISAIPLSDTVYLHYDKETSKYEIGSKDKLLDFNLPGNFMSLNSESCEIYSEGKFELGPDFGQMSIKNAGKINHDVINHEVDLDMVMAVDFFFSEKSLELMTNTVLALADSASPVDVTRRVYTKGLAELSDTAVTNKFLSTMGIESGVPSELEHSIVLTDLKLKWDTERQAYISRGKIGVGSILDRQLNRMIEGIVYIDHRPDDVEFSIYLEVDYAHWFFFTYNRDILYSISSDQEFNDLITKESEKDRTLPKENDHEYMYDITSNLTKSRFLRDVRGDQ